MLIKGVAMGVAYKKARPCKKVSKFTLNKLYDIRLQIGPIGRKMTHFSYFLYICELQMYFSLD
jgi:hypothetical protein